MPIFFQHQINDTSKLAIWKIEEEEVFFSEIVPNHLEILHPQKRIQHLAGRFLLKFMEPEFPLEKIQAPQFGKPFLPNGEFNFSISHCGNFAAAILSKGGKVGIDIELSTPRTFKVATKYLSEKETEIFTNQFSQLDASLLTLLWSAKEAVFKWYGQNEVDFRKDIQLNSLNETANFIPCFFAKTKQQINIHFRQFENLWLTWVSD